MVTYGQLAGKKSSDPTRHPPGLKRQGVRKMKTLLGVPLAALLLAAMVASSSQAACCGAASYKHVGCADPVGYGCAKQQCHTVMKTCREVVYDKQQYTCYRKC